MVDGPVATLQFPCPPRGDGLGKSRELKSHLQRQRLYSAKTGHGSLFKAAVVFYHDRSQLTCQGNRCISVSVCFSVWLSLFCCVVV